MYEVQFRAMTAIVRTSRFALRYSPSAAEIAAMERKFPGLATKVALVATLPEAALAELGPVSPSSSSSSSEPTRSTRPVSLSGLPPRPPTATDCESVLLPLERPR